MQKISAILFMMSWPSRSAKSIFLAILAGLFLLASPNDAFAKCASGNTTFFLSVGSVKTFTDHSALTIRMDAYDSKSGVAITGFVSGKVWFQRSVNYEQSFSLPIRCQYGSTGEMTFAYLGNNNRMETTRYIIRMSVVAF